MPDGNISDFRQAESTTLSDGETSNQQGDGVTWTAEGFERDGDTVDSAQDFEEIKQNVRQDPRNRIDNQGGGGGGKDLSPLETTASILNISLAEARRRFGPDADGGDTSGGQSIADFRQGESGTLPQDPGGDPTQSQDTEPDTGDQQDGQQPQPSPTPSPPPVSEEAQERVNRPDRLPETEAALQPDEPTQYTAEGLGVSQQQFEQMTRGERRVRASIPERVRAPRTERQQRYEEQALGVRSMTFNDQYLRDQPIDPTEDPGLQKSRFLRQEAADLERSPSGDPLTGEEIRAAYELQERLRDTMNRPGTGDVRDVIESRPETDTSLGQIERVQERQSELVDRLATLPGVSESQVETGFERTEEGVRPTAQLTEEGQRSYQETQIERGLEEQAARDTIFARQDLQRGEDFTIQTQDGQATGEFTDQYLREQVAAEVPGVSPAQVQISEGGDASLTEEGQRDFAAQQYAERTGLDETEVTVSPTGDGFRVSPTAEVAEQAREEARQQAVADLSQRYGVDLDESDIAFQQSDGQLMATLSDEGEATVAVETAPFRDVPVIGGLTTSGARARVWQYEQTEPFAETFDRIMNPARQRGRQALEDNPVTGTALEAGDVAEQRINRTLGPAQNVSQQTVSDVRNRTLESIGFDTDETTSAALPVAATATGTGVGFGTGTGTGFSTGVGAGAAGGATVGAAAIGTLSLYAGYQSGGVGPGLSRTEINVPQGEVFQPELDEVSRPVQDVREIPQTGDTDIQGSEIPATSEATQDVSELDETGEPIQDRPEITPTRGEQTPDQEGQRGETVVPGDYPLPGRDLPAQPSRDYVPEQRVSPVGGQLPREEQRGRDPREITEEDIQPGLPDPDQAPPLVRERIRREDLISPERSFFTGGSAVVGNRTGAEEARERIEEAQRQEANVRDRVSQLTRTGLMTTPIGAQLARADVAARPAVDVQQQQVQAQRQAQLQDQVLQNVSVEPVTVPETTPEVPYETRYEYEYPYPYQYEVALEQPYQPRLGEPETDGDRDEGDSDFAGLATPNLTDFRNPLTGEVMETSENPSFSNLFGG